MSTLNVSNITDGTDTVGTSYVLNGSAKAWVNFTGTGTVTIEDSLNTSSITDFATGNYRQSFSTSFANANYTMTHGGHYMSANGFLHSYTNKTSSVIQSFFILSSNPASDPADVSFVQHGDLA